MERLAQINSALLSEREIIQALQTLMQRHELSTYVEELEQIIYHVATHPESNLNDTTADVAKELKSFIQILKEVRDNDS